MVVSRMLAGTGNLGFDAARKVVRITLENAVSVASVLLLTEATMTEIPEKDNVSSNTGS